MSEYIQITFGTSSAAPKAVEYDRAMIIGDATPSTLSESKIYELTPSNWESTLQADGFALGDTLYDSVSIFFSPSPSPQRVWAYAYLSGAETCYTDVPLDYVEGETWETPLRPPTRFGSNIERVKFYCCDGGTGWTYNYADGSQGMPFTIEEDGAGNWTGRLTFDSGLSGADCGVVDPVLSSCEITVDFCIGSAGGIGEAIVDNQINLVSLALENEASLKNYADNLFGSQLNDIMTMTSAIAGKRCIWFYALPGDANPNDTIAETTNTWGELKNLIGARSDIAVIKAKPSALNHDMATGYMAMTVVTTPHKQMTFAEPHMGIEQQEPLINRSKWKKAQIASIMKRTELAGEPFLVTYGFTFGSGDTARINGTRCQYILAQTLTNNLWALLAKRSTLMSYEGTVAIRDTIAATFKMLKDKNIIDGLVAVRIPIEDDLKNNTAAGRIARAQRTVPAIEIDYLWYTSVEKIVITQIENVAT